MSLRVKGFTVSSVPDSRREVWVRRRERAERHRKEKGDEKRALGGQREIED